MTALRWRGGWASRLQMAGQPATLISPSAIVTKRDTLQVLVLWILSQLSITLHPSLSPINPGVCEWSAEFLAHCQVAAETNRDERQFEKLRAFPISKLFAYRYPTEERAQHSYKGSSREHSINQPTRAPQHHTTDRAFQHHRTLLPSPGAGVVRIPLRPRDRSGR